MNIEPFIPNDLNRINDLQPEGWPDIVPSFRDYVRRDFCYPYKVMLDKTTVGLGAWVDFGNTAWMAHVITGAKYRKKGIGSAIVQFLLNEINKRDFQTILLIATDLGEPIYKKAGFRFVSDYLKFERKEAARVYNLSEKVIPFSKQYYQQLIELDGKITAENRESLIKEYVSGSMLFVDKEKVKGFYLPRCGEGSIIAESTDVGLELMKLKYSKIDKAVIASENKAGIEFLQNNGFIKTDTFLRRMIMGKDINWQPQHIFSRIGGNFG